MVRTREATRKRNGSRIKANSTLTARLSEHNKGYVLPVEAAVRDRLVIHGRAC